MIQTVLWEYNTTIKNIHKHTHFQLVNRREVVVLVEFVVQSLYIVHATHMMTKDLDWNNLQN